MLATARAGHGKVNRLVMVILANLEGRQRNLDY